MYVNISLSWLLDRSPPAVYAWYSSLPHHVPPLLVLMKQILQLQSQENAWFSLIPSNRKLTTESWVYFSTCHPEKWQSPYHGDIFSNQGLHMQRILLSTPRGFPGGTSGKAAARQCRRRKRLKTQFQCLDQEDPLEESMAPTPVFLSGESHGQKSLVGYSPRGHKESDMTEVT